MQTLLFISAEMCLWLKGQLLTYESRAVAALHASRHISQGYLSVSGASQQSTCTLLTPTTSSCMPMQLTLQANAATNKQHDSAGNKHANE